MDVQATLTNLLTVNGVFSAILITYLFSRITWAKERKLEVFKTAISISQKITDYRRILNRLTDCYKVWMNDKATKSLISHGKFASVDFYDYRLSFISTYRPANYQLIQELYTHPNFIEPHSTLYLAMVSLVRNRNNPHPELQQELYNEFELNGLYTIEVVEKWLQCGIFETISYWLARNYAYLHYAALTNDKDYILSAICRINVKYEGQDLSNKVLEDITEEFSTHYLNELYLGLKELKKGVNDLNLVIIILVTISLLFGVLTPFGLLLIQTKIYWFSLLVGIVTSINAGFIAYFIFRFPILMNRELKWT